jgi:hypothetical protein
MMRLLLSGVLAGCLWSGGLSAQAPEVRGRVIDASAQPIADQTVLLHRVLGSSGASIGQARSDTAGRFVITADTVGGREATYFLAARWQGELYISEAFQAPLGDAERILQVGVPGTSATALLEGTATSTQPQPPAPAAAGGTPATATRWLRFAVPAISLLGVALYLVLRNRTGVSERRRLLARVARLDLEHAGAAGESYRSERAELMGRLRELTGG